MLIIPYVCAEFRDRAGNTLFRITPDMLRGMQEAPDSIRQDLLFDLLVADGSIKTPETAAQKKLLEQDPLAGMAATGKTMDAETGKQAKTVKADKPAKAGKLEPESEVKAGTGTKQSEAEQQK